MEHGKTIRQIAEELGVSKQAVHQKRKSKALSTALQPFTTTVDGVVYISVDGENLLKSAFEKPETPQPSTVSVNGFTPVDDNVVGAVDGPEHQLYAILKAELAAKDRQIEHLQAELAEERKANREQISKLIESLKAEQILHAGTIQTQLTDGGNDGGEVAADVVIDAKPRRGWRWPWQKGE